MILPTQNHAPPAFVDAIGKPHAAADATPRIVSLVPSLTELLCDLGLGGSLVGRTGFCVHPRETVRTIPKVGGTKDVRMERVRELAPTHVIVNIDENEKATVEELARFVPHVVVTHPLAPLDNLALYRLLGGIFGHTAQAEALCAEFDRAYFETITACSRLPRQRVLYLIWRKPWMTVGRDTYISRTLALVGWDTLPAESSIRYPVIELNAATLHGADLILLSSEPYRFRARDVAGVEKLVPAGAPRSVRLIAGELASWYGSRAIAGLRELARLRNARE